MGQHRRYSQKRRGRKEEEYSVDGPLLPYSEHRSQEGNIETVGRPTGRIVDTSKLNPSRNLFLNATNRVHINKIVNQRQQRRRKRRKGPFEGSRGDTHGTRSRWTPTWNEPSAWTTTITPPSPQPPEPNIPVHHEPGNLNFRTGRELGGGGQGIGEGDTSEI